MTDRMSELVNEKKCESLEEAQRQAGAEVANTGGFSVPVVMFRQGARINLTGALPMAWVKSRLESRPGTVKSSIRDTRSAWNRPEIPQHSKAICQYLKDNHRKNYIMPPLTLNIQQRVNLYAVDYPSEFRPGYLVIPATAKLAITDGQHRRSGIIMALEEMEEEEQLEFNRDAIAVMITCETDIKQVHQDFADCSKTKSLPPSMLAVFDLRNPANRLVIDLEEKCPLFKNRIDSTSKTLSKKSTFLFLANQVRQLVKELLAGSYALPDVDFGRRAGELLSQDQQYQDALEKYVAYINHLTQVIPVWNEISKLPPASLEASQIPDKRSQGWVCLSATGLNLIGRIGHTIYSQGEKNWMLYADRLGQIDWRRTADIWQGNIIMGNRLLTQQVPLKRAFAKICEAISWNKLSEPGPLTLVAQTTDQNA